MKTYLKATAPVISLFLAAFLITMCSTSKQSTQNKDGKTIVGEVADDPVTLKELQENYQSSSPVQTLDQEDLDDFLPVYLNYLAKLKEAKKAGYYEDPQIKKEYKNYSEQAAYSYWMENVIVDSLLNEYMDRRDTEIKASHILRRVTGQASPSDTLQAYQKMVEARQKYLNGASMDSLIKKYSSKQRGRPMGGEVGYFTGGNTIKSFEDVAYSLPVDSISMPVRTKYGYHLMLIHDKRERSRDRKVSHIFFSVRGAKELDKARAQANKAYKALEDGMAWGKAVMEFTQDKASRQKGGTIGWVNHGRLDPSFVDTVMSIDTSASYTEPVRTKYGYHIIKVDSIRSFASDSAKRDFMMGKLKELPRYKNRKQYVHKRLENLGNAKKYTENLTQLSERLSQKDTTSLRKMQIPENLASSTAYSINDERYSIGQFVRWLQDKHGDTPASRYRARWFEDYKLEALTDHLIPLTKERFPDFEDKIKNYKDGLVVFQITQDSVWNYAQNDTARLKKIYKAHPDSFRYGKRYHYTLFISQSDSLLQEAGTRFNNGVPIDSIDKDIKGVAIRTDSTGYVDDFPFSKLKKMEPGTFSNLLKYKDRKSYLYLNEILPARRMTFDEAYNRLVSFYQPVREKEWIQKLRNRYNIKEYPDRLKQKTE